MTLLLFCTSAPNTGYSYRVLHHIVSDKGGAPAATGVVDCQVSNAAWEKLWLRVSYIIFISFFAAEQISQAAFLTFNVSTEQCGNVGGNHHLPIRCGFISALIKYNINNGWRQVLPYTFIHRKNSDWHISQILVTTRHFPFVGKHKGIVSTVKRSFIKASAFSFNADTISHFPALKILICRWHPISCSGRFKKSHLHAHGVWVWNRKWEVFKFKLKYKYI